MSRLVRRNKTKRIKTLKANGWIRRNGTWAWPGIAFQLERRKDMGGRADNYKHQLIEQI